MSEYKKWEPDYEKYGTREAEHFSSESDRSRTRTAKRRKARRRSGSGARLAGTLALFMALVITIAFGGAVLFKGLSKVAENMVNSSGTVASADSAESLSDGQAAAADSSSDGYISEVALSSLDGTSDSAIRLTDVSDVVNAVMPAVVSITSRSYASDVYGQFRMAGPQQGSSDEEIESGVGSGTIVGFNSEELLILTSYHVVEGCSSLYVTFCDDSSVDGYIKDISSDDDIAVVAVRLDDISEDTINSIAVASISNEENEIGEGVIVIGDALGYGQSVVTGIISALDRQITVEGKNITVIQTDAAINSGNSGGCMLNSEGEVIGISEAKISSDTVEGMCYAISIRSYYDKIMAMLDEAPLDSSEIVRGDAA